MSSLRQPNLRYSQNFLKSRCLVDRLLDKSALGPDDVVYEIGPGKGVITERLAQRCRQVIAIEKDPLLVAALRSRFARTANVRLHEGDFLEYRLPGGPYKVFASIPFTITSAIVSRLTTAPVPPEDTYLMMQKEAAERFLGVPRETLSGVLVKASFALELLHRFRRDDFTPAPLVDVVMLRLCKRGPPLLSRKEMPLFRDFVVYGFTTPRPSLRAIFKDILTPRQCKLLSRDLHIDFDVTPTVLCFEQWLRLFDGFTQIANAQAIHTILGSETRLRRQQAGLEKMHRTRSAKSKRRRMDNAV